MSGQSLSNQSNFKPASKNFAFKKYPFYWIIRLGNSYNLQMEAQLKGMDLNVTYWRVGLILREYGKISMTEISKHAICRLPTITKAVYRMHELGLVEITQNTADKRVTMVANTEKGNQLMDAAVEKTSRVIDRAFEGVTKQEIETVNKLLQKIFDNISD